MWHHRLLSAFSLTCLLGGSAQAGENSLYSIYQALDSQSDGIKVCEVPFVNGWSDPVSFEAIARPHVPLAAKGVSLGDINVVSRAGIKLSTEPAPRRGISEEKPARILIFDFEEAKPDYLTEPVIKVLLECIRKTGERMTLHSRILHAEKYPRFIKLIEAAIPPETPPSAPSRSRLFTIYQPIYPFVDAGPEPEIWAVPYAAFDGNPETLVPAISQVHMPQQWGQTPVPDINRASLAGIVLSCEKRGKDGYTVVFDLTKLDKNWAKESVIPAILKCVEKTVPSKKFHSRILGGDPYPQYVKLIEARMPKEAAPSKNGGN